jgi:hypothetical protein
MLTKLKDYAMRAKVHAIANMIATTLRKVAILEVQ